MNIFSELEVQYFEIDDDLASKEFDARSRRNIKSERLLKQKRELNTHAYFLFAFTRLEDHIREQSSKLISKKQVKLMYWKSRAAWDILPSQKSSDEITFMKRVALLTDKSRNHYGLIKRYYDERNTIGHGGNFNIPINMTDVFRDMKQLLKILKKY